MAITLEQARAAYAEAQAAVVREAILAWEGGDCGPEKRAEIDRLYEAEDAAWDRMAAAVRATVPGREAEAQG